MMPKDIELEIRNAIESAFHEGWSAGFEEGKHVANEQHIRIKAGATAAKNAYERISHQYDVMTKSVAPSERKSNV